MFAPCPSSRGFRAVRCPQKREDAIDGVDTGTEVYTWYMSCQSLIDGGVAIDGCDTKSRDTSDGGGGGGSGIWSVYIVYDGVNPNSIIRSVPS